MTNNLKFSFSNYNNGWVKFRVNVNKNTSTAISYSIPSKHDIIIVMEKRNRHHIDQI